MSIASVEIVKNNLLFLLKLLLDNLSKSYSQTTPKITTTKTNTYIDLPNISAKININIMMILLASYLNKATQDKSIIKYSEKVSVDIAEWILGSAIISIEMCNENSAIYSRFTGGFYEESGFINGYGMISGTKNI